MPKRTRPSGWSDIETTTRLHIKVVAVEHIGKEANRWEEQLYLGEDPLAQITYGAGANGAERLLAHVGEVADEVGQRALAEAAEVSQRAAAAILRGERRPTEQTLEKLARAAEDLRETRREQAAHDQTVLDAVRAWCQDQSVRRFAALAGVHYPHLIEVLDGRRRPSRAMMAKLEAGLVARIVEPG